MNQSIIFIGHSHLGREYKFKTKDEERKFNLFWQMGKITDPYSQYTKPLKQA